MGEIAVRSAMSLGEYWGMPDKTREAYFPDGFFRPYDVGYLGDDGFLCYSDRAGDTIFTNAGAVYPHLVEAALLSHASVANCGVVGLGASGAQTVVAAVLLKAGHLPSDGNAEVLLGIARERLAEHERPEQVVFVEEIPTVLGGAKVQQSALRERLAGR